MPFDFSELEIPIFEGINDAPRIPTASRAGNGSHVIDCFNQFINAFTNALNALENSSAGNSAWTVTNAESITASNSTKIFFDVYSPGESQERFVILPSEPTVGTEIKVFNPNTAVTVYINCGNQKYQGFSPTTLSVGVIDEECGLLYINPDVGWVPLKPNTFNTTMSGES